MPLPASSDARALLAYLLVHHQQMHPRVVLAAQLQPDMSEARARHALSQAIWRIKQCLPDMLQVNSNMVGVSPQAHLWTDVSEFDAFLKPRLGEVKPADLSRNREVLYRAIQLYQGDLLEGFYDDWVLAERERLRAMYLHALERVIQLEKLAGNHEQALVTARILAGAEPLRESVHREIMRLNCLLHRPEAALKQYAVYCQALATELDTQPEAETIQLAQEIVGHNSRIVVPYLPDDYQSAVFLDSPQLPLVGRKSERAEIVALVEAACKGVLGFVLIEGEAGVGKTRLLQEIARDVQWRGAQVLWGKGKELEAASPYGPLLEALISELTPLRAGQIAGLLRDNLRGIDERQGSVTGTTAGHDRLAGGSIWLQVLCSLIPVLAGELPDAQISRPAPLDPAQEHLRLVEALSHLLSAWAQITPLVLILEDLHWADRDTLDTLAHLAEQLPTWYDQGGVAGGVLIIGSYRGEEARAQPDIWDRLRNLDRFSSHGRLTLLPLDAAATSELVGRSLGTNQPVPLFEGRLYRETNGNPLFVLETLRYLYGEELLWREADGSWNTPFDETTTGYAELPLSPVIENIITRRLAQLPLDLRQVLSAAAVLGAHFDFSTLAVITNLETPVALDALGTLVRRGFLQETAQDYRFYHDKVRLVAYNSLDAEEQIRLHRQAAQAIEKTYPVEVLAYHWTHGQVWDRAIHYHQLAAEKAQAAYTYAAAVGHINTAIQLLEHANMEDKRYELLAARETILDVLGEREAQVTDLDAMLQLAHNDIMRRVHVLCRKADLLANISRHDEAEAAAREALALAKSGDDKTSQATALMALGRAIGQGQPMRVISCLRQAVELSQGEENRAKAHYMLATTLAHYDQHQEAWIEAQLSLSLYEELQDRRGQAQTLGTLGNISVVQGENDAAIPYYLRSLQIAREIGYRHEEGRALGNLGNAFWIKGQVAQALQCYEESQHIYRTLGDHQQASRALMNAAYLRHYLLGDDDTAWSDIQAGLASYRAGDSARYEYLGTLGDVARCRGDFQTAQTCLESAVNGAMVDARDPISAVPAYYSLVLLALDKSNHKMALEYLEAAEAICQEGGSTGIDWIVKLPSLRGLVLLALGQPQAALAATSKAMAQLTPGVEQAYLIPFRHSLALSALGRTVEAHTALEQSYQMLSEILSTLSSEQQKTSWERVPEHRAILAAWQAIHPPRLTVRLPRIDTPTGRPLRDDEWVEVQWSVIDPSDNDIPDKVTRRHQILLRLLDEAEEQKAAPTVDDLAEALGVGRATIKRDLAVMRQSGHPVNTRGSRT